MFLIEYKRGSSSCGDTRWFQLKTYTIFHPVLNNKKAYLRVKGRGK